MKKYDTRIACFPGTTATAIAVCIIIKYVHGRRTVERFIVVAKKRRLYNIYIYILYTPRRYSMSLVYTVTSLIFSRSLFFFSALLFRVILFFRRLLAFSFSPNVIRPPTTTTTTSLVQMRARSHDAHELASDYRAYNIYLNTNIYMCHVYMYIYTRDNILL